MKEITAPNGYSLHSYKSIEEFIDRIDELKDGITKLSNDSSVSVGDSWYGSRTYEDALKLIYGFEIKGEKFSFPKKSGELSLEYNSISGGRVDIGEYLGGNPENMIQNDVLPDKPKMRVMYHIGGNCGFSNEELMNRARIVFGSLQEIEKKFQVEVYCTFLSDFYDGRKVGGIIKVKEFKGRFIKNIFTFTLHTAFFRRLCFRYFETRRDCPSGYGRNVQFPKELRDQLGIDLYIPEIGDVGNSELRNFFSETIDKILTKKEKRI